MILDSSFGRSIAAIVAAALAFATVGSACADNDESAKDKSADRQAMLRRTIEHGGIEREYFIHVPADVADEQNPPVVIAIHGYTSTATGFSQARGLNEPADKLRYVVIHPSDTPHCTADSATVWASALQCESGPDDWRNELSDEAGFACSAYSNCRTRSLPNRDR